jgi:hypothetical protein
MNSCPSRHGTASIGVRYRLLSPSTFRIFAVAAVAGRRGEKAHDLQLVLRVEVIRGFVEQEQPRLLSQRLGDGNAPPFAAGQ